MDPIKGHYRMFLPPYQFALLFDRHGMLGEVRVAEGAGGRLLHMNILHRAVLTVARQAGRDVRRRREHALERIVGLAVQQLGRSLGHGGGEPPAPFRALRRVRIKAGFVAPFGDRRVTERRVGDRCLLWTDSQFTLRLETFQQGVGGSAIRNGALIQRL